MQLQEMRAANQMGEDEPELRRHLMTAKDAFDAKMVETQTELEGLWSAWDAGAGDEAAMARARDGMVAVLNKRSYLRNLVRDVNEALGL
jgi:molecular chaperone HscB